MAKRFEYVLSHLQTTSNSLTVDGPTMPVPLFEGLLDEQTNTV